MKQSTKSKPVLLLSLLGSAAQLASARRFDNPSGSFDPDGDGPGADRRSLYEKGGGQVFRPLYNERRSRSSKAGKSKCAHMPHKLFVSDKAGKSGSDKAGKSGSDKAGKSGSDKAGKSGSDKAGKSDKSDKAGKSRYRNRVRASGKSGKSNKSAKSSSAKSGKSHDGHAYKAGKGTSFKGHACDEGDGDGDDDLNKHEIDVPSLSNTDAPTISVVSTTNPPSLSVSEIGLPPVGSGTEPPSATGSELFLPPSARPTDPPVSGSPTSSPNDTPTTGAPTARPTCNPFDDFNLCIAIDGSGSVCSVGGTRDCLACNPAVFCQDPGIEKDTCCQNFATVKEFSTETVSALAELPGENSFSVVQFANDALVDSGLSPADATVEALNDMEYPGGGTNHALAIEKCRQTFSPNFGKKQFIKEYGRDAYKKKGFIRRNGRTRKEFILIVTDGTSTLPKPDPEGAAVAAAVAAKEEEGITIIPIFISMTQDQDAINFMRRLSSNGNVFDVSDFGSLLAIQESLVNEVACLDG